MWDRYEHHAYAVEKYWYGTFYLLVHLVTVCYELLVCCAAKGSYDVHAEKRVEELQVKVRELERQNGQLKEKVCR